MARNYTPHLECAVVCYNKGMNTFTAKKLGEVHAFQKSALEQFERGSDTFREIHEEAFDRLTSQIQQSIEDIEHAARESDSLETVTTKSEKTQEKLSSMRDMYLTSEEDWKDPAELMEWSSFFHGAAYAHAELVCAAVQTSDDDQLSTQCQSISKFHHDLLHGAVQYLKEIGARRALETDTQ